MKFYRLPLFMLQYICFILFVMRRKEKYIYLFKLLFLYGFGIRSFIVAVPLLLLIQLRKLLKPPP